MSEYIKQREQKMTTQIVLPTNPADIKKILAAVKEADESLIRIAAEKDHIKAIVENITDDFPDLNKKFVSKIINMYHKQNLVEVETDHDDLISLYTTIVG